MWQQRIGGAVALVAGVCLLLVLAVAGQEEAPPPARPTPTRPPLAPSIRPPVATATLTIDELIPPEIRFSSDFVEQLRAAEIEVQQIRPSLYATLLPNTTPAVFVRTSQGSADVAFLPPSASGSAPRVVQHADAPPGRYQYSFRGRPVTSSTIDSNEPLYFVTRPNLLLITHSHALRDTVDQLLDP